MRWFFGLTAAAKAGIAVGGIVVLVAVSGGAYLLAHRSAGNGSAVASTSSAATPRGSTGTAPPIAATLEPTASPSQETSPTVNPSDGSTPTPTPTETQTETPIPTTAATATPTASQTPTPTAPPTSAASPTPTATPPPPTPTPATPTPTLPPPTSPPPPTPVCALTGSAVTVGNNFFSPANLCITPGTTVTWTWAAGSVSHTVTSNTGLFDSGSKASGTFAYTFNTEGTFSYHCQFHVGMTGTVTVTVHTGSPRAPATPNLSAASPALSQDRLMSINSTSRIDCCCCGDGCGCGDSCC